MNGLKYIQRKQVAWSKRKGLTPVGSTFHNEGEKNYLEILEDNLFQPLTNETKLQFENGDGNETKNTETLLAKMKALHSSSAIVVNLFQYWQNREDIYKIAYACGLCRKDNKSAVKMIFEEKFQILPESESKTKPNIDIVIHCCNEFVYAIESKFSEIYGSRSHSGMSEKYFNNEANWQDIPAIKKLAEIIKPNDNKFRYLHAAQLIKHILGLKKKYSKKGFRLLYLWYDVIGQDGVEHRKEIEQFAEIVKEDKIKFSHLTYQEVILKLTQEFYVGNEEYCNYLTNRYL